MTQTRADMTDGILTVTLDRPAAMNAFTQAMWARGASADARECVGSFVDKRPAAFTDRVSEAWLRFAPWPRDPSW